MPLRVDEHGEVWTDGIGHGYYHHDDGRDFWHIAGASGALCGEDVSWMIWFDQVPIGVDECRACRTQALELRRVTLTVAVGPYEGRVWPEVPHV